MLEGLAKILHNIHSRSIDFELYFLILQILELLSANSTWRSLVQSNVLCDLFQLVEDALPTISALFAQEQELDPCSKASSSSTSVKLWSITKDILASQKVATLEADVDESIDVIFSIEECLQYCNTIMQNIQRNCSSSSGEFTGGISLYNESSATWVPPTSNEEDKAGFTFIMNLIGPVKKFQLYCSNCLHYDKLLTQISNNFIETLRDSDFTPTINGLKFNSEQQSFIQNVLKFPNGGLLTGAVFESRCNLLDYLIEHRYCISSMTLGSLFSPRCILILLHFAVYDDGTGFLRQMFANGRPIGNPQLASSMRFTVLLEALLREYGQNVVICDMLMDAFPWNTTHYGFPAESHAQAKDVIDLILKCEFVLIFAHGQPVRETVLSRDRGGRPIGLAFGLGLETVRLDASGKSIIFFWFILCVSSLTLAHLKLPKNVLSHKTTLLRCLQQYFSGNVVVLN